MKKFSKMLALGLALALTFGMTVSAKDSPTADDTFGGYDPDDGFFLGEDWEPNSSAYSVDGKISGVYVHPHSLEYGNGAAAVETEVSKEAVKQVFGDGVNVMEVIDVLNLTLADKEHHTLRLEYPQVAHNQALAFLHYPVREDGTYDYSAKPEVIWCYPDVDENGNFCYSARLTGGSPYVLVLVENQEGKELSTGGFFAYPAGDPMFGTVEGSVPTAAAAPGTSPKTGETLPVAGMMAVLCLAGALVCIKKASYNA